MTEYALSPGFVLIKQNDGHRPHTMKIPVFPVGTPVVGTEPAFETKSGGSVFMSTAVSNLVAVLKTQFPATTTFSTAEFWYQATEDSDPVWVYEVPIGVIGTSAGAATYHQEIVMSFRSFKGHLAKLYLMAVSGTIINNQRGVLLTTGLSGLGAIAAYALDNDSWLRARDDSVLVAPLNYSVKTNDVLRNKELGV